MYEFLILLRVNGILDMDNHDGSVMRQRAILSIRNVIFEIRVISLQLLIYYMDVNNGRVDKITNILCHPFVAFFD